MISRRNFLHQLAIAGACSGLLGAVRSAHAAARMMYDPPKFGKLSLLQIGDTHGQLLPGYCREPSLHIGIGPERNQPPCLVGEHLLERYEIHPRSQMAYGLTHLHFEDNARRFGKTGGYAELATVIGQLRSSRKDSLLLDCGDTWQGSATSLWTQGADMVRVSNLLGVDAMTGDSEFQLGSDRLRQILDEEVSDKTRFLAYNLVTGESPLQKVAPHAMYFVAGVPVGVIGQAYPHFGRMAGRPSIPFFRFGIDEVALQQSVNALRARGAKVIVLLSHAGLAIDIKLAGRVRGIDVVFSGHTHDPLPEPLVLNGPGNRTLVSSVGAYGKFCGVLDLDFRGGKIQDYRYHLIPVLANQVPPDPEMKALISRLRAPYISLLEEKVADNDVLLYRRGGFHSTIDQLILDALLNQHGVEVAFTPGHRWGTTLLPGDPITFEHLFDQTGSQNAAVRVEMMSGEDIRRKLEESLDEVFNADPYLRSGNDVVRVFGLIYHCRPASEKGKRIKEILVGGSHLVDRRVYRVASWGLDSTPTDTGGEPMWKLLANYLKGLGRVRSVRPSMPLIDDVDGNYGFFPDV